jgi:hypothetical protein
MGRIIYENEIAVARKIVDFGKNILYFHLS